ncbi:DUF732 domain-containing protein [Streptomyces sp. DSM 42041]|uniref:DUF732 domain-containing protein n=1 Tax=Streptomyces hazeniae TaxID=3075538 RepID=A0ABU2NWQ7_9ACTN|nr:DUF732 domain-containing protein [Streptomyces sp. DSM 42041]MDT0381419.1 DUF732 domain-containing protein [Streptomyces sp. DSM 42041]
MRRHLTTTAGLALAALTLTACGADNTPDTKPQPETPAASSPTQPDPGTGIPPEPTGAARDAYLAALEAIDPQLVADADKAIDAGRNQCSSLNGGGTDPAGTAAARFSMGGNQVSEQQAKAINQALRQTLCPK